MVSTASGASGNLTQGWREALATLLGLFLIVACSPANPARSFWRDYQARLEQVLGTEAPSVSPVKLPEANALSRRLALEQDSIGLLELAAINHCRLGELIAAHNSSLGKVAQPSSRLRYQIEFIQAAPRCIAGLKDKDAVLAEKLSRALSHKKSQAMAEFIDMLNRDTVIRRQLFIKHESLTQEQPLAGLADLELALRSLLTVRQQIEQGLYDAIDVDSLDIALQALDQNPFLSRYMAGMQEHVDSLHRLNALLDNHPRMRCKPGHERSKQEILLNVLIKFFLGRIQPYLAAYNEAQFRLQAPLRPLFADTRWQTQIDYYVADNAAIAELKQALRQHVALWQRLQQSCSLEIKPGTAGHRPG